MDPAATSSIEAELVAKMDYPLPSQIKATPEHISAMQACPYQIGDKAMVHGCPCTIKYIGPLQTKTKLSTNIYAGIAFDNPLGQSNGTVRGITYFTCEPRHGLFVRLSALSSFTPNRLVGEDLRDVMSGVPAAPTEESRAFSLWNAVDQQGENEALHVSAEIDMVDHQMSKLMEDNLLYKTSSLESLESRDSLGEAAEVEAPEEPRKSLSTTILDNLLSEPVDSDYEGPLFEERPDAQFALDLLDYYRTEHRKGLPRSQVLKLLLLVQELLEEENKSPVFHLSIPQKPDVQLILVGDVHGQLNDVLWLFYKFGAPSPSRIYLFNGDVADRGRNAVEIFLLLFAFKLAAPSSVYLNRGNHESADMNEIYGFAREVRSKYGPVIYHRFQEVFNYLPLCTIVEKRVLVIHGGLLRQEGVTLETIAQLDTRKACPSAPVTYEDSIIFDLLWADPRAEPGVGPSGRGADCIAFGPDVTERFLRENALDVCIRSHQVPSTLRGFEANHEGRCVTLFSASNYCGASGNLGGVIIFDPKLSFEIQEYMAPSLREVRAVFQETKLATAKINRQQLAEQVEQRVRQRTRRASILNMRRDILRKMSIMICQRKSEIWNAFWAQDKTKRGVLLPDLWRQALAATIRGSIPWDLFIKKLNLLNDDGFINYNDFLKHFRVEFRPKSEKHANWRFETVQQVYESIMKADLTLKETLMVFDRNCDGTVSYTEFCELLRELKFGFSEPQMRLLMRIITAHYVRSDEPTSESTGKIDVAEFLGRFKVIYSQATAGKSDTLSKQQPWMKPALLAIGKAILADKAETAKRHYIASAGSVAGLAVDGSSHASRRRSSVLRSAALFQKFKDYAEIESDGDYLSYQHFVTAVQQLAYKSNIEKELGFPLTKSKLLQLAQAIDVSGSGKINYLEFLNAFHVTDSNTTTNIAEEMWEQICAKFFEQKVALSKVFVNLDPGGTGRLSTDVFRRALSTLNAVLGPKDSLLTPEQIDLVANSIDHEEDGLIDYTQFLESFVVVDITSDENEESEGQADDGDLSEYFITLCVRPETLGSAAAAAAGGETPMQDEEDDEEDAHMQAIAEDMEDNGYLLRSLNSHDKPVTLLPPSE